MSDYELLELVLFRAIPQRDVKPLAKELIARFGSFAEVVAAPSADIQMTQAIVDVASRCTTTSSSARKATPASRDCG